MNELSCSIAGSYNTVWNFEIILIYNIIYDYTLIFKWKIHKSKNI